MKTENGRIVLELCEDTLGWAIEAHGRRWTTAKEFAPYFQVGEDKYLFSDAGSVTHDTYSTGLGEGIVSRFAFFGAVEAVFETIVYAESATGRVICTFVPHTMPKFAEVFWPMPLTADEPGSYAVVPNMQGTLIPTGFAEEYPALPFDGQMCSCAAYLPMFGDVALDGAYMCEVIEPWDAKMHVNHPAGGVTRTYISHLPSLGRMDTPRTLEYTFLPAGSDFNDICKTFRARAEEKGRLITLRQKAARVPSLDKLVGCSVYHVGIKTHVSPDSAYYDTKHPENNDSLVTFDQRAEEIRELKRHGAENVYLHLDGWGQPGYDNQHPDYLPACAEAGGWDGMRRLNAACHEAGYLFGIHDQYRDYYLDAPSYDPDNAIRQADGKLFYLSRWAGGKQNYLCASLAPAYLQRNFEELFRQGIKLDAVYLDVFTCNEGDECINPRHPMTRYQSLRYRKQCFDYMLSRGILTSSEEVNDWATESQVFCHWAPYGKGGIPVPLFNLVYHDCLLTPWMLDKGYGIPEGQSGMLHALLNGGMAYISDGTIPGGEALDAHLARCKVVSDFNRKVAYCELVKHELLTEDGNVRRSTFSDGSTVTVDFAKGTYEIA